MHSEKSMSKLKNCMYRAAYTVTALKNMVGMTTYLNKKTNIIPMFKRIIFIIFYCKRISLPKTMAGT